MDTIRGFDLPVFHLIKADILQFNSDAMVIVTDEEMVYDRSTPCRNGGNPQRPGWYSWRIVADMIPVVNSTL